jgi:hypothetical protein
MQIGAVFNTANDPASGVASLLLTMTITNNGPSSAGSVSVVATVPALAGPAALVKAAPVSPLVISAGGLQADPGSVNKGQTLTLTCMFIPFIPAGSGIGNRPPMIIAVSGTVSSSSPDPIISTNSFNISALMPVPAQVVNFTGASNVRLNQAVAFFSKHLQAATVTEKTFKISDAVTGASVSGAVSYDDLSKSAIFAVSGDGFPVGNYLVTLVGTGPAPILDVDGYVIDGDSSGRPGGDFIKRFSITG